MEVLCRYIGPNLRERTVTLMKPLLLFGLGLVLTACATSQEDSTATTSSAQASSAADLDSDVPTPAGTVASATTSLAVANGTSATGATETAAASVTTVASATTQAAGNTQAAGPGTETPASPSTDQAESQSVTTVVRRLGAAPPDWLGTRPLPLRPGEDNGIAQPTPAELIDRQLWTDDKLAPPVDDVFVSRITSPPPAEVLARSTWGEECPRPIDELAYAQVSFFGFDGLFHTGEFIVGVEYVEGLVGVFAELHAMRFPIEQMVVTTQEAVDAEPTGDGNNTSSFVCRQAVNSGSWSRHALGGAIDINPFHNPYVKGDLVIPELASAYLDRGDERNGMVTPAIVELFAEIGWGWGGNWSSASDWMHFSDNGR